ncbi:MAG: stage IV sporulation protein A [Ruminococcaceae bacterium]|nr:stage IV sporulation protein A [Oscillospiraceae bacterium]
MAEHSIYRDIAQRTGGDIYIGVVGPVRSGKSTFIKRFMESLVLPNIEDGYSRDRARDEMPQSAAGKTVMTTEPKFVPDEAVSIKIDDCASLRVKMIDCVGYIVSEALGTIENGQPRMVHTPWQEAPMPFVEAAEMGTEKVIKEHSTIGMLISSDGTIGEISRESYAPAEERIVNELKSIGKPFAMILNSADPSSDTAISLAYELEEKYGVPVALVSCIDLNAEDISHILELVLHEFPVTELSIELPVWMDILPAEHKLRSSVKASVCAVADKIKKAGDIKSALCELNNNEYIEGYNIEEIDLGTGKTNVSIYFDNSLYYSTLSELTGFEINDESDLIKLLREFSESKCQYERVAEALAMAEEKGYGIVMPTIDELHLEEPEIVKQSGGYGVKLSASAQSIHLIRANIETEINPIVGTEQQSQDLIKYLLTEFEEEPGKIWESNVFGKSLYELVNEGLHTKLEHMPEESRTKLSETLERIINEGSGGLICILL